jgi:hypothetical protein
MKTLYTHREGSTDPETSPPASLSRSFSGAKPARQAQDDNSIQSC